FDLFDTLVRFDRERMPEIEVNGKTVRSSAGLLHAILTTQAPQVGPDRCYEALGESWREAERLRAIDHREVPAAARFAPVSRACGPRNRSSSGIAPTWTCWAPSRSAWTPRGSTAMASRCRPE